MERNVWVRGRSWRGDGKWINFELTMFSSTHGRVGGGLSWGDFNVTKIGI